MPITQGCIYVLKDPRCGSVRYVGQTIDPEARYQQHLRNEFGGNHEKQNWISTLLALGMKPQFEIVEQCSWDWLTERESFHCKEFTKLGAILLNRPVGSIKQCDITPTVEFESSYEALTNVRNALVSHQCHIVALVGKNKSVEFDELTKAVKAIDKARWSLENRFHKMPQS